MVYVAAVSAGAGGWPARAPLASGAPPQPARATTSEHPAVASNTPASLPERSAPRRNGRYTILRRYIPSCASRSWGRSARSVAVAAACAAAALDAPVRPALPSPSWQSIAKRLEPDRRRRDGGAAADQLRAPRGDGRRDARRDGALRARGDAAAGELGRPRARAGGVLVLRQQLARPLPQRRARPRDQGAVPRLRVADGEVRVLRQPALRAGPPQGPAGGAVRRPPELRDVRALRRASAGGARVRGGDRLAARHRRRVLGADARSLQRARARRARLRDRPDARPAELAAAAQHRAPRGHGGHERGDGGPPRGPRRPPAEQVGGGLLGGAQSGRAGRVARRPGARRSAAGRMARRPTIRDVAQRAGVHPATASRALNPALP